MNPALVVPARNMVSIPRVVRHDVNAVSRIEPDDPALCALTDFRQQYPPTVPLDWMIEDALTEMDQSGAQAILVIGNDFDEIDHQVLGLITQYDIECRKPHRNSGCKPTLRSHLKVSDVMTTWTELSLVHYDSLIELTAAELLERFQGSGLTHLLVIETHVNDSAVARGLLSRAALARSLARTTTRRSAGLLGRRPVPLASWNR